MPAECGGSAIPDLTHSQSNFHQISQRFLLCVGLGVVVGCAIRRFIASSQAISFSPNSQDDQAATL